ncbi:WD40 repeat-like protein [Paxillus ammoniavirescens]|nr:WD40 repeat-like protein [Paxillus ammoniavirescens]
MSQQFTELMAKPITTISGHEGYTQRIAYLPGGERVVTCSGDKTVRIWNVEKGEQEGTSMVHEGWVLGLAVTRDGKKILSGGEDKRIRVWDVETHEPIEEWASQTSSIWCIALSPDDQLTASGGNDGEIVIRKMKDGGEVKHSIHASTGSSVSALSFSPNGEKLACAVNNFMGKIYVIQLYDVESGELVLGPITAHEHWVHWILWSLDGGQLFSASDDHTIRCWDHEMADIGEPWTGHARGVYSLSLSPDGTKIASASRDKTVRFWDTRSGNPLGHPLQHEDWLYAVDFSPSGEFVASGGYDRKVSIWRVPWSDEGKKQAHHSLLDTAWDLDEIHSNFTHDLTGYVVREGGDPFTFGGFGDIYRGKLRVSRRSIDVAVKAIRTYSTDDGDYAKKNKRIRRELKTWVNLKHVNILPLFGTTMNFGRFPAMVCPWLENGSLTSYLERRHDALTLVERFLLIRDAAAGLQYLHSQSIVHGDLSGVRPLNFYGSRAHLHARIQSNVLIDDNGRAWKVPYHYYIRDAQVLYAISKDIIPRRPSQGLVTDRQWTFIQRCWTTVDAGESRPHDDEIVEFARQELIEITKASS